MRWRRVAASLLGLSLGLLAAAQAPVLAAGFTVEATVDAPDLTISISPDPITFELVASSHGQQQQESLTIRNSGNVAFKSILAAVDEAQLDQLPWSYVEATSPSTLKQDEIALAVRTQQAGSWESIPRSPAPGTRVISGLLPPGVLVTSELALLTGPNMTAGTGNIAISLEIVH